VVTLDTIILVLLGVVEYVGDLFFDHGLQRLSKISVHLHRIAMSGQGLVEGTAGSGDTVPLGDIDADDGCRQHTDRAWQHFFDVAVGGPG